MLILYLLGLVLFLVFLYIGESKPAPWNTTGSIGELRALYRSFRVLCWLILAALVMILPFLTSMPW